MKITTIARNRKAYIETLLAKSTSRRGYTLDTNFAGYDVAVDTLRNAIFGENPGKLTTASDRPGRYTMNATEIKLAQDNGKTVCIVDIARTFDLIAAKRAGVDVERLLVSQPDTAKQAREITESVVRSGVADILVVFGSLPAWSLTGIRDAAAGTNTALWVVS